MTFRRYLELVRKRWWVVAVVFSIASITTAALSLQQPWVYQSEGTFIVKPRSLDANERVRATETLIRGPEISATFAFVGGSNKVADAAKTALPEGTPTGDLTITSDVVTGRNAIKVTVRGGDPAAVYAMAMAASEETVRAVSELNDSYDLDPLDLPDMPRSPVAPNKPLTIALGVVLGIMAGVAIAIGLEYLGEMSQPGRPFNITDESLDVYNDAYFNLRFREEISRARRGQGGFSVGVMKVGIGGSDQTPRAALRHAVSLVRDDLREEDLIAYLGDGSVAVLMPNVPVERAEGFMARWEQSIAARPLPSGDGTSIPLDILIGVAEYDGSEAGSDTVTDQVSQIL